MNERVDIFEATQSFKDLGSAIGLNRRQTSTLDHELMNMNYLGVDGVAGVKVLDRILLRRDILLETLRIKPVPHVFESQFLPPLGLDDLLHQVEFGVAERFLIDYDVYELLT